MAKNFLALTVLMAVFSTSTLADGSRIIIECDKAEDHLQPEKLVSEYSPQNNEPLPFHYVVKEKRWDYGKQEAVEFDAEHTPTVAMRTANGWLLGADRGEFGGELVFATGEGETYVILEDVITDILEFPFGFVALAGLSHLSYDEGRIYLVNSNATPVKAQRFHGLPGAPRSAYFLNDGSLLIRTSQGALTLSASAQLTPVICHK